MQEEQVTELTCTEALAAIKQAEADGQDLTADNNYAIRSAARNGHLEVVRYLLEECAQDIDATANDNYALRLAAWNGHLAVVKYLLDDCDQDVDATAADNAAIRYAAENGHLDVLKYLLDGRTRCLRQDLVAQDHAGVRSAGASNARECAQDVDATANDNYALSLAAENGHLEVVKYLIADCAQDADATAGTNWALRHAAENGHIDVVQYLAGTLSAEDIKSMDDASLAEHQQCVIALRRVGCIDDAQLTKLLQNEAVQHALRLKLPLSIDELIALCKDNTQATRVLKQL